MTLEFGKKIISQEAAALKKLSISLDRTFISAINILYKTKGNIIVSGVGKSGHIARKIVSTMNSIGTRSIYLHPTEASHGDLGLLRKGDTIIILSKSGNSSELKDIVKFASKRKISTILISNNLKNNLSKFVNCNIAIPDIDEAGENNIAPTSSTTMMLALGDAMALTLSKKKNFSYQEFGIYHPGGSIGSKFLKVKDIMHKNKKIPLAKEQDKMNNIIIEMSKKSFGCVGIVDKKKNITGIITDGDLRRNMSKVLLEKRAIEVMSKKPKTICENTYVLDALKKLNCEKITAFFVVKDTFSHKPIGIIHLHDCLRIK